MKRKEAKKGDGEEGTIKEMKKRKLQMKDAEERRKKWKNDKLKKEIKKGGSFIPIYV
jgi:uncharacterized protein YdcH (DUF465 family)